ncbi:Zinc-binding protein [Zea mays]|nr:Zinc-binding protein [Zea mays]
MATRAAAAATLTAATSSLLRFVRHIASSSNEEAAARAAAATADAGGPTIFDKIIAKEIPSSIVYEDENVLAFRDINPQAPVHAEPRHTEILGRLLYAAKVVAEKEGVASGYRVVINNGAEGCQSVYHLHLHVLGGRQMKWPPG